MFSINDEYSTLKQVVIGLGTPYQTDKARAAYDLTEYPLLPETDRKADVMALEYPFEALLTKEFAGFTGILKKQGVQLIRA